MDSLAAFLTFSHIYLIYESLYLESLGSNRDNPYTKGNNKWIFFKFYH